MFRLAVLIFIFLSWQSDQSTARLLRAVTVVQEPYYTQKSDGTNEGFLVDLMDDLIERTNYGTGEEVRHRFYLAPDSKYGQKDENGRWNGMIGEVINGEADMAVAPITVTKTRYEAVHFSHPFMSVVTVPILKKPNADTTGPFMPSNLTDLYSRMQLNQLSLGYVQHGSTETYMSQHKIPEIRAMYNLSKSATTESPYVDNYAVGVQRVRTSNGRFIFYGEHTILGVAAQTPPCDLVVAWHLSIGVRYYSFVFPKTASGRQWADKFNELLLAAEEDGTIAKLTRRWWDQKAMCQKQEMCMCREETSQQQQQSHSHSH